MDRGIQDYQLEAAIAKVFTSVSGHEETADFEERGPRSGFVQNLLSRWLLSSSRIWVSPAMCKSRDFNQINAFGIFAYNELRRRRERVGWGGLDRENWVMWKLWVSVFIGKSEDCNKSMFLVRVRYKLAKKLHEQPSTIGASPPLPIRGAWCALVYFWYPPLNII